MSQDYLRKNSKLYNTAVSGIAGLSLLVNGCIESINGMRIRSENKPGIDVVDPFSSRQSREDEDKWYEDPYIVGGIVLGAAVVGAGSYFLYKELSDDGDHKQRRRQSGEGNSGPGGQ